MNLSTISGIVKRGKGRGKDFGFPTANISLTQTIPEGIYVSHVHFDGQAFQALTFIGSAKTFGETDYKAESYLLDFDEDLYDKTIEITLLKKLRDNEKFDSEIELVEQMKKDLLDARSFFHTLI